MISTAWGVAGGLAVLGIATLTAHQVRLYRSHERGRGDLYPYTKRRLLIRCSISICLVAEVGLFLGLMSARAARDPHLFARMVLGILIFAGAMLLLAILDFRESRALQDLSEKRLFQEFLHDVRRGKEPPATH